MIAFVAGHPSVDRLYEVEQVRPGVIHRPALVRVVPGGKGLNAARVARLLGGQPHVLAILAGHAGRWIADALRTEGVEGTFVWTDGETRTSVSVSSSREPGGLVTGFYEGSEPIATAAWSELEAAAGRLMPAANLVCLSGGLIDGAPLDGYQRIAELARAAGVPVAIDSHGEPLIAALDAQPELIKVNAEEAAEALGVTAPNANAPGPNAPVPNTPGPNTPDPNTPDPDAPDADADADAHNTDVLAWAAAAAAELQGRVPGNRVTAVTCGTSGIALVERSGAALAGRLDQVGRYPVGSGDAVLASLALDMCQARPADQMLARALAAGAANAEVPGPGILDPTRVSELAAHASIAPIRM